MPNEYAIAIKTKIIDSKQKIIDELKRYKIEYFLIIITTVIALLLFDYGDCIAYTAWSIEIWESLFNGRIGEYFTVSAENKWGSPVGGNCYGVLWLIPWGIWNLPIWIIQTICGNYTVDVPAAIIWSKLFLILCVLLIGVYSKKIVKHITDNEHYSSLCMLLCMGGGTALISVGYSGQDEVMYMASFIMGSYYLLVNRKLLSYIFLIFSVVCFPLMILPVSIVVLVKEKNLIKCAIMVAITLIPDKIVSYLCGISAIPELRETYLVAGDFPMKIVIDWYFLSTSIWAGKSQLSILGIILAIVLILCYLKKHDDNVKTISLCIAISFLSIFMLSWMHFYRYYSCMVPAIIAIFIVLKDNSTTQRIALFVMCLIEYSASIIACYDINCMSYKNTHNTILGDIINWNYDGNFMTLLIAKNDIVNSSFEPLLLSASVGLCILLLWLLIKKPIMECGIKFSTESITKLYVLSPLLLLAIMAVTPLIA